MLLWIVTLVLQARLLKAKVEWQLSTKPAVFGEDVVLTCNVGRTLTKSKECPVRQWSGGPTGRGLLYNQFPSNITKYMDRTNLESDQFALVIRDFRAEDVSKNYTCSCGFDSATKILELNNSTFISTPAHVQLTEQVENETLSVKVILNRVYPIPTCSIYSGDRLVLEEMSLADVKGEQIFYKVRYSERLKLKCNEQIRIECIYPSDVKRQHTITINGNETDQCFDDDTDSVLDTTANVENEKKPASDEGLVVLWILVPLIVGIVGLGIAVALVMKCRKKSGKRTQRNTYYF